MSRAVELSEFLSVHAARQKRERASRAYLAQWKKSSHCKLAHRFLARLGFRRLRDAETGEVIKLERN